MSYENLQYDSGMQLKTHRPNHVLFTTQCFFSSFFPRWRLSVGLLNGLLTYLLTLLLPVLA